MVYSLYDTFALKYIHYDKTIVEIANFLIVRIFNDGYMSFLKVMEMMGIIDSLTYDLTLLRDKIRLKRPKYRAFTISKNTRIREERTIRNNFYEVEEGVLYNPGIDD